MPFLTASNYYRTKDKLLHKLRVVNAALDKLLMIQPPRCFGYGDKLVKYLRIGLDGNLTPEAIQKLIIADEVTHSTKASQAGDHMPLLT